MKDFFSKTKKIFFQVFFLVLIFNLIFLSHPVMAEKKLGGLEKTASELGYATTLDKGDAKTQLSWYIGTIASVIIGFIGIIFMVLIFLGALDIIGAGGNDEKVKSGRDKIKNGALGMLVVFSAYALTYLIFTLVAKEGIKIF